jgi:hypothetical protein
MLGHYCPLCIAGKAGGVHYSDVFIITDVSLSDSVQPFTSGLQEAGIPVWEVEYTDTAAMKALATRTAGDKVTVTDVHAVWGLERAVIVYMDDGAGGADIRGRLMAMSRCTSQLVCVEPVPV